MDSTKAIYRVRPLEDSRWNYLVEQHPLSSVFHTSAWLRALEQTFHYEPIALTTSPTDALLDNAVVFCHVDSWVTNRRLVSLPFSDHCDLLVGSYADLNVLVTALEREMTEENALYLEVRPKHALDLTKTRFSSAHSYCLHEIDLKPDLDTLFHAFHKDSAQRKIRRAEREGLTYEEGNTRFILDSFLKLMLLTRRRHQIPPHPKRWFENLIDNFGDALRIRLALKDKRPVAASLTLRHRDTLIYKYGCSDARFHQLGGMHFLFWKSIQDAKREGLSRFDLGRSESAHSGLVTFKDRLGATRSTLEYFRYSRSNSAQECKPSGADWKERIAKRVFSRLPDRILSAAGDVLYRHIG